jgi:hypothetical protein
VAIQYARWPGSISFGINSVAISRSFGISFGTASVVILQSFGMEHARSTWHLSSAFVGLLDVRRMLGELIVLERGVYSLALLPLCLSSLDSVNLSSFSESTSRFMSRCTSGAVIVCGKGCDSGTVIPFI